MPDINANLTVDITGNTAAIATDYVNNTHFQVNKLAWGDTGAANRVSTSSPFPVDIRLATATVGVTGSVAGLGNFKVINGTSTTLIVTGTTSSSYTPVQINGTIQGVTSGVLVGVTGTINVNSITILGGSTMTLLNPVGITGGRKLNYTTDSITIQGSTVGVSSIPDLLQSKDSVRAYSAAGATQIPVTLFSGSGDSIGSSGGALNVNIIGAGISASVTIGTIVGVCQASPFYIAGATAGPSVRVKGTNGAEESVYVKFYENPTIATITNPVTVDLTSVVSDTYLIKQKLDTLSTKLEAFSDKFFQYDPYQSRNPAEVDILTANVKQSLPLSIFAATIGITAGSMYTLPNQSVYSVQPYHYNLERGVTIKNLSDSNLIILGTYYASSNYKRWGYTISPGEIIFLEILSLEKISIVNENATTKIFSYIAS